MKKFQTLVIASLLCAGSALMFTACSKSSSSSSSGSIIGTWEATSAKTVDVDAAVTPPISETTDTTYTHGHSYLLQFNSNSTYTSKDYTGVLIDSGGYTAANGKIYLIGSISSSVDSGSYTISGSTLTFVATYSQPPISGTVTEIFTKQ